MVARSTKSTAEDSRTPFGFLLQLRGGAMAMVPLIRRAARPPSTNLRRLQERTRMFPAWKAAMARMGPIGYTGGADGFLMQQTDAIMQTEVNAWFGRAKMHTRTGVCCPDSSQPGGNFPKPMAYLI